MANEHSLIKHSNLNDNYILSRKVANVIPIKIKNLSQKAFASGVTPTRQLFVGYRIIRKEDNKPIIEGRSILEMDIFSHHEIETGLRIPGHFVEKGNYIVEVGLVEENKRWILSGKWFILVIL